MSLLCPLLRDKLSRTEGDESLSSNKSTGREKVSKIKIQLRPTKMMNIIKSGFKFSGLSLILVLITITVQFSSNSVRCQDFEDLKNVNNNNNNINNRNINLNSRHASGNNGNLPQFQFAPLQPQQVFQPNRQSLSAQPLQSQLFNAGQPIDGPFAPQQPLQTSPNTRQVFPQRSTLSNRFSLSQIATPTGRDQQQQQGQLSAQASTSAGPALAVPRATSAFPGPGVQQASSGAGSTSLGSTNGNIEQVMKNALARSAKLESSSIEARQDSQSDTALQSRSGGLQFQSAQQQAVSTSPASRDRSAESSETTVTTRPAEDSDKPTSTAGIAQDAHETVYSDQRFANLFARRATGKKSTRFQPTEQVKAKPTLPSFIKSPPDPKQFTQNPLDGLDRPSSGTNIISARLQQQQQQQANQNRVNSQANSQKKTSLGVTSVSAANASNKRANSQKLTQLSASNNTAKASNSSAKNNGQQPATTGPSKPSTINNPFIKSQTNNNDPANVIAMARRRLLANNALQQKQAN